jgi:GNAT superfamily N-acetyltransferase
VPLKRFFHHRARAALALFPRSLRFAVYRSFVDCDHAPDARLSLKIADTREELEACFRLLHDAYVGNGFMQPHPSGMRINIYHALPTTTTLCAKFDGEVVGTISLIRESLFGFPLQSVFDLRALREQRGRIAEVSALAVHARFRNTGGSILFPLMKFMYEYCEAFFDTRHLVIAVNPRHIELYESLLLFQRLQESPVDSYDFANGAPAVGATLDLQTAEVHMRRVYRNKRLRKDLYRYFADTRLPNIQMPNRRYYTTNDPVMTPELLDHFFNHCRPVFQALGDRERALLHSIYTLPSYKAVLPALPFDSESSSRQRAHARYSLKCPAVFTLAGDGKSSTHSLLVIECSDDGFLALSHEPLPLNAWGEARIQLGQGESSVVRAQAIRVQPTHANLAYGFTVTDTDLPWRTLVGVLRWGITHEDLTHASRFLPD